MKKIILAGITVFFIIAVMHSAYSLESNESMAARGNITSAEKCFDEMIEKNISIQRVNESLREAKQLYDAQFALEQKGSKANYKLVNEYSLELCELKETAVKAKDELMIFIETYNDAAKGANLSSMDKEYEGILKSFEEERFDETSGLISKGYTRLSEVEASQTALNLFYDNTTKSLKKFFSENWKIIGIVMVSFIFILVIFGETFRRAMIRKKISALRMKKDSILQLIKKTQGEYFTTKRMSEGEFSVKIKTFTEMIRDVDRQLPVLNEKLAKVDKDNLYKSKKANNK